MIIGFGIWTVTAVFYLIIGISSWRSEKEVGFFTGVKPPKMKDVKAYNHAVAKIWFWFAGLLEAIGVPLLFVEQNSPVVFLIVLAMLPLVIGAVLAYLRVEAKYRI